MSNNQDSPINFKLGFPAESLLEYATQNLIRPCQEEMWASKEIKPMSVLPYIDNLGLKKFRRDLVERFGMLKEDPKASARERDAKLSPKMDEAMKRIMITHGCSQGMFHLCTHLRVQFHKENPSTSPLCLVEEPTYFIMPSVIQETGWTTDGIPLQKDGIDLDKLEQKLKEANGRVRAVYTVGVNHNPTGVTTSDEKRMRLIELAHKYNFYILSDEVYQELSYEKEAEVKPYCFFEDDYFDKHSDKDRKESKVLSVGSFSKVIAPGLKLGYVMVCRGSKFVESFSKQAGLLFSGGGLGAYSSGIVHQAMKNGAYEKNLHHVKQSYASRLETLYNSLDSKYFEPFTKPRGGYFMWVKVKLNSSDQPSTKSQMESFHKACEKYGVQAVPGEKCFVTDGGHNYIRLCFGWLEEDDIREGVKRLCKAAAEVRGD